jgi:hypothetical protein
MMAAKIRVGTIKNIIMINKSISKLSCLGLICAGIFSAPAFAQVAGPSIKNAATVYEDERIKITLQDCSRKQQDTICQATLTSKSSDRQIDLNGNTVKLVDLEGNEYYATSVRLANRISDNNSIKTELVENIPFRASFVFSKVPTTLTQVALFQIPLSGSVNVTAKFRNVTISDRATTATTATKPSKTLKDSSTDNTSVCPDNTKVFYRASSRDYLLYICGAKNPTHYVGLSKDGTQGITLRLRYYDRTQFSADNGDTNYTIAANRLVIRKDSKVVYQDKIQVLQSLPGTTIAEEPTPKAKVRKNPSSTNNNSSNSTVVDNPKRSSIKKIAPKTQRQAPAVAE